MGGNSLGVFQKAVDRKRLAKSTVGKYKNRIKKMLETVLNETPDNLLSRIMRAR